MVHLVTVSAVVGTAATITNSAFKCASSCAPVQAANLYPNYTGTA